MSAPSSPSSVSLAGTLEGITYYNSENHYTVARLKTDEAQSSVTIVGYMPGTNPGDSLSLEGKWESHARFGQQFKVITFEVTLPQSIDGVRKYLASGFIKGVGEITVNRMINTFGEKTLQIIETEPEKLTQVKGIAAKTAQRIAESWREQHAVRHLMRFLQDTGINTAYSARILKQYGTQAIEIISSDPYRIVSDIPAIGFYVADAIALNRGVPKTDPGRVRACVLHEMQRVAGEGHTFVPEGDLCAQCVRKFEIDDAVVREAVSELADTELVSEVAAEAPESNDIYLKSLHEAETGIALRIRALLSMPPEDAELNTEDVILNRLAIQLSREQQDALENMLRHRVVILTGGPGTGKTTLIRSLTAVYDAMGRQIVLAAPTGRAAKRLAEVTGKKATTIHRLLGYQPQDGLFEHDRDNPIDADGVVIDEASMVDVSLMHHLLSAVHLQTRIILVGDVHQLPPVGPGNVLSDMIASQRVKTFELQHIFRQAQQSPIVLNAHRVRTGQMPDISPADPDDGLTEFYFFERSQPQRAADLVVELCTRRIPDKFDLDPIHEIQVLTPMHKGEVGTLNLNQALQQALNPRSAAPSGQIGRFRPGDKVMHLRNNYQKEVFNGDIGTVAEVDKPRERLRVDYEGRLVDYDTAELDELTLAYAISVHKSQGSEYPAVVVPLLRQHYPLLQRNLLYTAITRGRRLVVIIGSRQALEIALNNDKPRQRLSSLARRLST
jgi:exodeoxyribonuclease V alpha subunit